MNDISSILEKIGADAKAAEGEILAAAQESVRKIQDDYAAQAAAETKRVLDGAARQADALRQRAQSQSGIDSRNIRLGARRQVMDKVFVRAMELLCGKSADEKAKLYADLAAKYIASDAELVLSAGDAAVGAKVIENLKAKGIAHKVTLDPNAGRFEGGFILRQGNIETNCTFEVLIAGVKEEVEPEVVALLFQ